MRSAFFAVATFALGALATPTLVKKDCNDTCMTYDQATVVANNFKSLIAAYSDADAIEFLTPDFTDYSDSVSTLINSGCAGPQPLGAATFTDRPSFMKGQGSQPAIPFEIQHLWYACTGPVVIRWATNFGAEPITGNIIMEATRGSGSQPWLISNVLSEFNSGAWLVNLDVFKPSCYANGSSTIGPVGKRDVTAQQMKKLPYRIM
ncbi:hypothetical protein BAUCODRAFT_36711 [Baudoinia panamericana UAMH 10762]|uniref:NTF2-like domain-containing protein n=1 Tax=Baudoinia panamericana (strain UAMH 10762) TaxID=717646 RepID=M2LJ44_BAUPA|nr:uncharacterized protein BAUCODRAFT_36711 [Baudoinia panamericana UAMH 10762]EMC94242.1 hypothetical protein BAUCODRAFT_36711 [Baudoinia panamericana UAMH 10762]